MKRKLSSLILALAVMASISVPAFAADCQTATCPANALLWQMLCQYGGLCGNKNCGDVDCDDGSCAAQTPDVNALLGQLLKQYNVTLHTPSTEDAEPQAEPEQESPAEPEKETPTESEKPTEEPTESEQPTEPEQGAEPERPSSDASAYEREVIRLVNAERAKYGLAALQEDAALTRTARMKSQDMRDNRYFDHNSPTYGTPFQLMKSQGIRYRTAGENIAMGYATPEAVVNAWMNSSGHRANILNSSYTKIGVGYVESGNYWTQHFAG